MKSTDASAQLQWIVPRGLQTELMVLYHATPGRGHLRQDKVYGRLVTCYWWPSFGKTSMNGFKSALDARGIVTKLGLPWDLFSQFEHRAHGRRWDWT